MYSLGAILSLFFSLLVFLRFYGRDACCSDRALQQWTCCCPSHVEKFYQPGPRNLSLLRDSDGRPANIGAETGEAQLTRSQVRHLARLRFHSIMSWTMLWAVGWGGFLLVWCVAARAEVDWGERA